MILKQNVLWSLVKLAGNLKGMPLNGIKKVAAKNLWLDLLLVKPLLPARTMGHAGAIVGGSDDTAQAKKQIMRDCGIHVVESPAEIGKKVAEVLA